MVLPLLLYQSGTISLVALPANLVALLPMPWAMFFSLVAGAGALAFGPNAMILSFPAYALLWYVISISHALAALPFSAVSIPGFSVSWMVAAYASLIALLAYAKTKTAASGRRFE